MEDFYIDIMIGAGEGSRSVHLDLPPHSLIGNYDTCGSQITSAFGVTGPLWNTMPHADLTEALTDSSAEDELHP